MFSWSIRFPCSIQLTQAINYSIHAKSSPYQKCLYKLNFPEFNIQIRSIRKVTPKKTYDILYAIYYISYIVWVVTTLRISWTTFTRSRERCNHRDICSLQLREKFSIEKQCRQFLPEWTARGITTDVEWSIMHLEIYLIQAMTSLLYTIQTAMFKYKLEYFIELLITTK